MTGIGATQAANSVLRFALELTVLASLAGWGWRHGPGAVGRVILAVALPVAAAYAWGQFAAPRAPHYDMQASRRAVEVTFFAAGALALLPLTGPVAAASFAVVAAANATMVHVWHQHGRERPGTDPRASTQARP
jgi:hypothetical protein